MQLRELSKPITAKHLNESLVKNFGYKLKLEQFNDAQLEDVRNKLRTEMSQFEVNESFDNLHENPKYQKTRALLDVINQEIMEREMNPEDKSKETNLKKKYDKSGMKKNMQKQYGKDKGKSIYFATIRKKAMDHSVPESWIDSAINRMELGESDQEELKAELQLRYDLRESIAHHIVYLAEGEEEKAKNIMAAKDMVDRITGWLEDTAQLKAEQLLELVDSIRENQGSDAAQQFQSAVKPALEAVYSALETSRQNLQKGLSVLSGGEAPDTMGSDAGAPDIGGMESPDMGEPDAMGGDEEGGAPAAGGAPDMGGAGRDKRMESVEYSRRLGQLLAQSKKK
jgi:hypothetical protein